jgi:hypothetical protein
MDIKKILKEVEEVIKFDEVNTAHRFIIELENYIKKDDFQKQDLKTQKSIKKIITKLKWVALPYYFEKDILEMFNGHLQVALEMEYFDIWDKLKNTLVAIILHEDRDKFKQQIKKILERNKARISENKLSNNTEPTVENWIKKYSGYVGLGVADKLKFNQFIINDIDIKRLDEIHKKRIVDFFKFYERLKLSSLTVAGIEESVPVNTPQFKGYIRDGRLEKETRLSPEIQKILDVVSAEEKNEIKINSDTNNKNNLQNLLQKYPEGSLERRVVEEEIKRIKNE